MEKPIININPEDVPFAFRGLPMELHRVGVCENKGAKFAALFHRGIVKTATKYRVFVSAAMPYRFIEMDPCEFKEKYRIVQEHKVEGSTGRPA